MGNSCHCLKISDYNNKELNTDKKEKISAKNVYINTPHFGYTLEDSIINYDTISFRAKGAKIKGDFKENYNIVKSKFNNISNKEISEVTIKTEKQTDLQNNLENGKTPDKFIIYEEFAYDFFDEINNYRDDYEKFNNLIDKDESNFYISIFNLILELHSLKKMSKDKRSFLIGFSTHVYDILYNSIKNKDDYNIDEQFKNKLKIKLNKSIQLFEFDTERLEVLYNMSQLLLKYKDKIKNIFLDYYESGATFIYKINPQTEIFKILILFM